MKADQISGEAHVDALKMELWGLTGDVNFKRKEHGRRVGRHLTSSNAIKSDTLRPVMDSHAHP